MAVITRTLITNNVIPYRLVNTKSNSLNKKSPVFTTMSTIYEANIALIKGAKIPSAVAPASIPYAERDKLGEELSAEWRALINGIGKWKKMLGDPSEKGDGDRIKIRKESLLGWPIGQLSLFNGYSFACQRDRGIDRSMLVRKLNRINWNQNSKIWNEILVHPNKKIMSGKTIMNNASKVVAHMIGAGFTKKEKMEILYSIYGKKRGKTLPNQIKL